MRENPAAGMLAPGPMAAALICMPDEWTEDDQALGPVNQHSNDKAAIVRFGDLSFAL